MKEIGADIVAGRDFACEEADELWGAEEFRKGRPHPGPWEQRQEASLHHQLRQMEIYEDGNYSFEFMPVIQGYHTTSYEYFMDMMDDYGLSDYEKFGVGTVCKRAKKDEILDVVETVRDRYGDRYLHLFGATLNIWKDKRFIGKFDSSDTAAWHWGSESKEHQKELLGEYREKVNTSTVATAETVQTTLL